MRNQEYINRINKALEYIDENLDQSLRLNEVAAEASYSPFHFHRLFTAIIGENLNSYVSRRRIEKAAQSLMFKDDIDIGALAADLGFSSTSVLSRTFKKHYGISPSEFMSSSDHFSKIRQPDSKNGQQPQLISQYIRNIEQHLNWLNMNTQIEIKALPERKIATVQAMGVQEIQQSFNRIIGWATPKNLMNEDAQLATVFHDSFKITSPDKVRMSIGIMLKEDINNDETVKVLTIPQGRYIIGRFELLMNEFEQAWTSMFIWMNENGYQKADVDPYEIYYNDYRTHPQQKCICDLFIPII